MVDGRRCRISPAEFVERFRNCVDFARVTLTLEVVAVCSLRCPGCWVAMARPEMWSTKGAREMSPAVLGAALGFGRAVGATRLTLLGGEPTLHTNLPDVIRRGVAAGYAVSVTTNGVCASARLERVLSAGLAGISFSLDGSRAEIHDTIRPSASGLSTFARTVRSITEAVSLRRSFRYRVCVNHTIVPRNLDDVEPMIRLAAALGVDHVRLHFTLPGDYPEPCGRVTWLDPDRWRAVVATLPGLARELGIAVSAPKAYGRAAVASATRRRSPYLTLQPDGHILLCAVYARLADRARQPVGQLRRDGSVLLNPCSAVGVAHPGDYCCGGMSGVLAELPSEAQAAIEGAGGLGCVILDGPLVTEESCIARQS